MLRLVRAGSCSPGHRRHIDVFVKLPTGGRDVRILSTSCVKCHNEKGDDSDSAPLKTGLTSRQALLSSRRRPLSPLERISSLLPQDALSPEVMQLREQTQQSEEDSGLQNEQNLSEQPAGQMEHPGVDTEEEVMPKEDDSDSHRSAEAASNGPSSATLPNERLLTEGEMLLAEYRKKNCVEFRKMFRLQTGKCMHSNWGMIRHGDIVGRPAGCYLKTSTGTPILMRRPSLEEYTLYMERNPAILHPKDAAALLMMMDVTEGDHVLESGSGSGAMSLFLSRAVGSRGRVLSVDVRKDHYSRAMQNYKNWRTVWGLRRGDEWPDNVEFHNTDICTASWLLAGRGFNGIVLDLINPHLALPSVIPHLHPGGVCAVNLVNISQVIDLLEGVRCFSLPLLCERIIEVPARDWVVAPGFKKGGGYVTRKTKIPDGSRSDDDGNASDRADEEEQLGFGSIPYVAKPHPRQMSHTAFLVKLRKIVD
ncbi:tRNA (adenine(58)-N(1))-methyltransferase, mitochondrial isoform 2-T2 [Aulostomus maculatus]